MEQQDTSLCLHSYFYYLCSMTPPYCTCCPLLEYGTTRYLPMPPLLFLLSLQHDTTLLYLLSTLGIWNNKIPPYASALILELHQFDSADFRMKIFFKNDTVENPTGPATQMQLEGEERFYSYFIWDLFLYVLCKYIFNICAVYEQ